MQNLVTYIKTKLKFYLTIIARWLKRSCKRRNERIEGEIATLEAEKRALETEKGSLWNGFLTIILFFVYFIKKNELDKQIMQIDARINEFKRQHQMIFRDYNVSKLSLLLIKFDMMIRVLLSTIQVVLMNLS